MEYDPTPIALPNCCSAALFPEGSTRVTLSLKNLQKSGPPSMFRGLFITGLETTWTTDTQWQSAILERPTFTSDKPIFYRDRDFLTGVERLTPVTTLNLWEWLAELGSGSSGSLSLYALRLSQYGLFGCDYPEDADGSIRALYVGCDAKVEMQFYLPGQWSFTDQTRLRIEGAVFDDDGADTLVRCTIGVDCRTVEVPEPSSVLLLARGILGLAYVRRRRAA